jgi:hypothetical protein
MDQEWTRIQDLTLNGPGLELDNIRMLLEYRKAREDTGAAVGRNVDFRRTF